MSAKHTKECRERFSRLVEAEKKEAEDAAIARASSLAPPPLPAPAVSPEEEKGAAPGAPSAIAGAAVLQVKEKSVIQLVGDVPACFGMPATTSKSADKKKRRADLSVRNKRDRKKEKKDLDRKNVFIEFACAPDSTLCQLCEDYSIPSIRLSKDNTDLLDPNVIDQLIGQIEGCDGRPNLWTSIPCTSGSPWATRQPLTVWRLIQSEAQKAGVGIQEDVQALHQGSGDCTRKGGIRLIRMAEGLHFMEAPRRQEVLRAQQVRGEVSGDHLRRLHVRTQVQGRPADQEAMHGES